MKTQKIKFVLFTLVACTLLQLCIIPLYAQKNARENGYLEIFGKIKNKNKSGTGGMEGAVILVTRNDRRITEYRTGANGRFDLQLDMNCVYTLQFSKEGMVTKTMQFNTMVPDSALATFQYEYKFNVNMVEASGAPELITAPVAKIYYAKKYDGFDYDHVYAHEIQLKQNNMTSMTLSENGF